MEFFLATKFSLRVASIRTPYPTAHTFLDSPAGRAIHKRNKHDTSDKYRKSMLSTASMLYDVCRMLEAYAIYC